MLREPLVDRVAGDPVRAFLNRCVDLSRVLASAGEFIACGHCGLPITGERKTKPTKAGVSESVYHLCARYNQPGHPRIRVREEERDRPMLALFEKMKVADPAVADWFQAVLRSQSRETQAEALAQHQELSRQHTLLRNQQSRLLDMRLADQLDQDTIAAKHTELRDRLASIQLQLESVDRTSQDLAELALKVFELSQTLTAEWLAAEYATKRRILEIVCLPYQPDGAASTTQPPKNHQSPTMRKPFDVLAEGLLVSSSRDRAQMFEPIQTLAATCVREYPVDRPPQLRFLARLVDEELAP